jgi:hypothetical protein
MPTITHAERRWALNEVHRFHIRGTGFVAGLTVSLSDNRGATWQPVAAPSVDAAGNNVVFSSHPTSIGATPQAVGALTITITNPDGSMSSQNVSGTYQ